MSQNDTENRRQHRRVPASALPSLTARISGGAPVKLLDVSRRGVRLETSLHMRPGQTVCIRFVRATVAHVESDGIRYETALSLAGDLLLCDQLRDAALQEPEPPVATAPAPVAALSPVVDYTVIVRDNADAPAMLEGLQANSW